jgi:hypothetical protein
VGAQERGQRVLDLLGAVVRLLDLDGRVLYRLAFGLIALRTRQTLEGAALGGAFFGDDHARFRRGSRALL